MAPADGALAGLNRNPPAMTAKVFADTAMASDLFELQAAKLARNSGRSPAVKAFADMMISDHAKSAEQLKSAAGEAGVTIEEKLSSQQEADLTDLRAAGARFDTVFAQQQIVAHSNALAGLRQYGVAGDSQPLKNYATGAVPVIEAHLRQANKMQR
jgi:putative membrane protein